MIFVGAAAVGAAIAGRRDNAVDVGALTAFEADEERLGSSIAADGAVWVCVGRHDAENQLVVDVRACEDEVEMLCEPFAGKTYDCGAARNPGFGKVNEKS